MSGIKSPAGIYIRAVTSEEIALSIMAEITELSRTVSSEPRIEKTTMLNAAVPAVNPVCGMTVEKTTSEYSILFHGERVYFCCENCKNSFVNNPERYVIQKSS